ncbi:MAG: flagellar biosynthetic protein FliO [Planctomycetes bacterium]|nr:flagellar biosynthetic protein FliO [Planctomycetota bacterium]
MRFATVLVPEVGRATGPDLTRYLVVCTGTILALLAGAWLFRRFLAGRLRVRAAKRSLQVLDVLPLSGKQKLVVVRCYERSFLLGLGEKEVRAIAELDVTPDVMRDVTPDSRPASKAPSSSSGLPFSAALADELVLRPALPARGPLGTKEGLLA